WELRWVRREGKESKLEATLKLGLGFSHHESGTLRAWPYGVITTRRGGAAKVVDRFRILWQPRAPRKPGSHVRRLEHGICSENSRSECLKVVDRFRLAT